MTISRRITLLLAVSMSAVAMILPGAASALPSIAPDQVRAEATCFGPWYRAANGLTACYGKQSIHMGGSTNICRKGTLYFYGNPLWFTPSTGWGSNYGSNSCMP